MSPRDPYEGYEGDDTNTWSAFPGPGPRWSDDEPPEDYAQPPPGRSVFGQPPGRPRQGRPGDTYDDYRDTLYDQPTYAAQGPVGRQQYVDDDYDDSYADSYRDSRVTAPHGAAMPPPTPERPKRRRPTAAPGDRDLRVAVGVALALAATALILFQLGPPATMVLVVAVLGLASLEYFTATQRAGFDPLTPVGLTATVGMLIAAYHYGEVALPLVIVLTVAVCLVWYLIGAGGDHPMRNIGATLLGVCWVGLFGSYAALLLAAPNGIALLLAAVIPTVGYDVGAFFVGRSAGSRPLSSASPNKTIEGLAGGMLLAVVAGVLLGVLGPAPFDGFSHGVLIGLVAAAAAPLGDLSQSLVKRDLRIKDMGTLLPGHGGVLDRFDSLLFVLPAIWYLTVVVDPPFFL
jgi:phosphatidate cytidylyltransferase